MIRILARILFYLSVILAMAIVTGNQAGAATACPYASTIETLRSQADMPEMAQDTAQSGGIAHHGHSAMPEHCKHGCTVIAAVQPNVTTTPAIRLRPLPIRTDANHLPSRQTPPIERPPNPVA